MDNIKENTLRIPHTRKCPILFPPDACCIFLPTIHLEMHETEILHGCQGFQHCKTTACFLDFSHGDGLKQSLGHTELKLASHLSRLFCCEPITTTFSPIVNSVIAQICEEKPLGSELAVPLAPSVKNDCGCKCNQLHTLLLF